MPQAVPASFLPSHVWSAIAASLGLSKREAEIAWLIMHDESERAIAGQLRMSAHTVHTHLERLYRKLNARSRCQLVVRIFRQYVDLESARARPGYGPASGRTLGNGGWTPLQ